MPNFIDFISSIALSFTVSGNTGIAPFLTLFIMGSIEKANPDILNMGESIEKIIASWYSISFLGILATLESIGHCVPVVDELMDSAVTFIIPIMSVLGSLSTFGVLKVVEQANDDNQRELMMGTLASGALITLQIAIVVIGIGLALSMHLFKMLLRLSGEGWLTQILTVFEISYVVITILLATFVRPLALITGSIILLASGYSFKRRYWDGRKNKDNSQEGDMKTEGEVGEVGEVGGDYVNVTEVETDQAHQKVSDMVETGTAV